MLFDKGPISLALLLALTLTPVSASAAATDGGDGGAESPWLLAPTLTSDPKLGTSVGAIAGYLWRLDSDSVQSMVGAIGSYSDTDSHIGGVFADLAVEYHARGPGCRALD